MSNMRTKEELGLRLHAESGIIDLVVFEDLLEKGYLNRQTHPTETLWVWNYSQKTQFESYWTPETVMCRGLVTDFQGEIVARPFKKFWNMEEHMGPLPTGPYEVWEKVDGSLGVIYYYNNRYHVSTRGSFVSDQAIEAEKMLYSTYKDRLDFLPGNDQGGPFTHLAEIVFPENRIVLDYGAERKLVYLGSIHTKTGWEIQPSEVYWPHIPDFFGLMDSAENPLNLKLLDTPNKEGFVLRYAGSGVRLKIKFDTYLALNHLLFGLNAKAVWEMLMNEGEGAIAAVAGQVPDEYYGWIKLCVSTFKEWFAEKETVATQDMRAALRFPTMKERAMWLLSLGEGHYPHLSLAMLNGQDYSKELWRSLRPKATLPFGAPELHV